MSTLTFKRATIGPFQGINTDNPIIIEFPRTAPTTKKRPITKISGDQGRGKSSLIHFLLYATGQKLDFKQSNLVNLDNGMMQGGYELDYDGQSWKVQFTKTKFEIFRHFTAGNESGWIPQSPPDAILKKIIGNVAISPMKLKVDDGKKQVDWLFKMVNAPENILLAEKKLAGQIKENGTARAQANREYEYLKKNLNEDPLYISWAESEKKFREIKTVESEKKKFEAAEKNKTRLVNAKEKLAGYRTSKINKETEIEELKEKLAAAELGVTELTTSIREGETFIETIANAEQEYEVAHTAFIKVSEYLAEQGQWQTVKLKKAEMEEYESLVQRLDTQKDKLKKTKRDLLKKILPGIDGLDVVTEDELDGPKAGLYLDDKTPIQLSESELFDLYFKVCEAQGVSIVLIENISSFGTDVIKTLNAMAKRGVYIWATEMKRGQQDLRIEFVDELI